MNKPSSILQAAPADTKARFTAAEFLRMAQTGAFDDMKVELIDGGLERMNPPMSNHGTRQMAVGIKLAAVVDPRLLTGETGIDFGDDTILACDAAILKASVFENRMLRADDILLVVEVAETTAARDLGMKRIRYAAAGIAHYWVIDGARSVTHVYGDPIDGDYAEISTVRFGHSLAVPATNRTITLA